MWRCQEPGPWDLVSVSRGAERHTVSISVDQVSDRVQARKGKLCITQSLKTTKCDTIPNFFPSWPRTLIREDHFFFQQNANFVPHLTFWEIVIQQTRINVSPWSVADIKMLYLKLGHNKVMF